MKFVLCCSRPWAKVVPSLLTALLTEIFNSQVSEMSLTPHSGVRTGRTVEASHVLVAIQILLLCVG